MKSTCSFLNKYFFYYESNLWRDGNIAFLDLPFFISTSRYILIESIETIE